LSIFGSRFFWRLYASYALLVLATTTLVGVLVDRQVGQALLAELESSLRDRTLLVEPFAARSFTAGIATVDREEITRLGERTATRVTLIRPDGVVIADTDQDPAAMDNHADRPEVIAAAQSPFGTLRRYSHTIQQGMLYVARAVRAEDRLIGTVRAAVPLTSIEAQVRAVRRTIAAGALIGVVVALLVGIVVARQITAPIAEMTVVAESIGRGDYARRLRLKRRDEIGVLAATLTRLGAEVTRRIATISHDQAQLRAMIAGMVEGVIAVDDEDRVLHCNQAACALLDLDPATTPGRKLWEIVRLADLVDLLGQARERHGPVRREIVLHRNGMEMVLNAHATAFTLEDSGGLVVVLHDISDVRRLERIRRDFVANVSHELKTPLTSIKGYVETLLDGALFDERNNLRFLEKIDAHVVRLTDLVRDLLDLAHIEAREESLPLAPVDWRGIVEDALRRHEAALETKGLTCVLQGTNRPLAVRGERLAMTRVIDNLLDNAIKYTPSGGAVTIRLAADGALARLEVEDTGVGIPEHERERIFERFYRVDKARSRDLGGTGLGLSIVKHCVQAMGGDVYVESRVGKGSRFTVRLALAA
jgi:two-component system phosphate regulon sensor histidine kinase PhoR